MQPLQKKRCWSCFEVQEDASNLGKVYFAVGHGGIGVLHGSPGLRRGERREKMTAVGKAMDWRKRGCDRIELLLPHP